MLTDVFLGLTLIGSQWVLGFLILLSIVSVALIFERWSYFRKAPKSLQKSIETSLKSVSGTARTTTGQFVYDGIVADARLKAENRLSWLATIGSNAPFVGLFGTVLGIIKAFHDLSQQGTQGSSVVSAGISEALVATAVGLFVAIPAVIAYNYFQRKVRDMLLIAERTKNNIFAQN